MTAATKVLWYTITNRVHRNVGACALGVRDLLADLRKQHFAKAAIGHEQAEMRADMLMA